MISSGAEGNYFSLRNYFYIKIMINVTRLTGLNTICCSPEKGWIAQIVPGASDEGVSYLVRASIITPLSIISF